jgi:hypothetical protein
MAKKDRLFLLYTILFIAGVVIGGIGFTERLPWKFGQIFFYEGFMLTIISAVLWLRNVVKDS